MRTFSYQHLHYFWVVAREGSITAAADVLGLTQPTISTQVAKLERSLGTSLFARSGGRLELTEAGRVVQRYAAEIFLLGDAMEEAVRTRSDGVPQRFAVGIVDSLPLLSAYRLLGPALRIPAEQVRLTFRMDKRERLIAALAARSVDLVLSDSPTGPSSPVRVDDHLLIETGVSIFGTAELAETLEGPFPGSLHGAPFLLHTENSPLRRALDTWFAQEGLVPAIAGEVEEVALLQILGSTGRGFFAAPHFVEAEVCNRYSVVVVGQAERIVERFYGLTLTGAPRPDAVSLVLDPR